MVFTRRRLTVCVVGAMCASSPPAEGFTPPGLAPLPAAAGESFYCCSAERRLAATAAGSGSPAKGCSQHERRAVARVSMASSSRIAPAGPRAAARSEAAKAAAAVARKRAGRNRKPSASSSGNKSRGSAADRYEAAGAPRSEVAQSQQQSKLAEAAASPPPSKGFRRRGKGKRVVSAASGSDKKAPQQQQQRRPRSEAARSPFEAAAATTPTPPPPPPSSSSVDSLATYFKALKRMKLLKLDEEIVLGRHVQRGLQLERVRDRLAVSQGTTPTHEEWASTLHLTKDEMLRELAVADKAKNHMISANLSMVVKMARHYQNQGLEFPDLIQEGTMGLVKATERYNPEAGFKFSTYATWWIRTSLFTAIANQSRVIRLPKHVHEFLRSIERHKRELTVDGKLPTDEELGDKLGATVQKIQYYREAALRTDSVSLATPQGRKSNGVGDELGDQIGDTRNPQPEDASQAFYMKGKVTALLATLKEKERQVVRARYGLDGDTAKTLEQIGREMGVTRERVRQIESKALGKLRQPYRNYRLREQRPAFATAGGEDQPAFAAAGDRPLNIEFKQGVDASESTQAVEAVLVAALDRTPTGTAAAVSKPGGRRKQAAPGEAAKSTPQLEVSKAENNEWAEPASPGRGTAAAPLLEKTAQGLAVPEGEPARVVEEPANGVRPTERLDVPAVTLTPDSRRLLLDMTSHQQGVTGPGTPAAYADATSKGAAGGSDDEVASIGRSAGSSSAFAAEPLVGVGAELPAAAAAVAAALTHEEQRALEIESKRKSLNKAWNKKSEAAVDRLERELAQSAAALAMLEMEQEEWERSMGVGDAVEEKSLSMASL